MLRSCCKNGIWAFFMVKKNHVLDIPNPPTQSFRPYIIPFYAPTPVKPPKRATQFLLKSKQRVLKGRNIKGMEEFHPKARNIKGMETFHPKGRNIKGMETFHPKGRKIKGMETFHPKERNIKGWKHSIRKNEI